ncbi:metallopeptidase family protein [Marisediminicola senii]|uniref:metallopeptidase family protein n=1 Tax=Marisediminicola senii TaxID=2711233 RepID=UPI0013EA8B2E|nr:metallopeptidase family protein [Marisediminicola senii]
MAGTSRRDHSRPSGRGASRDRHGRGIRSAVTGPFLPPLNSRADVFEGTVAATAEYLRDLWEDELADVTFEVADLPRSVGATGVDRWLVVAPERRVVLFRLPIERLARARRVDELQRRMLVETSVFRAVAELLGKDPWDLAPDRFRHLP